MKSDKVQIYEIREGDEVIARYDRKTPAQKRRKELKKSGRKVKLYSLFVRKFVPLEPEVLPKGMAYWDGIVPWEIPPEASSQLHMGWEHINDVFFIGSYRDGELCKPYDRTGQLSIQPKDGGLALCYHNMVDGKTYLVLDRIDWIRVTPTAVDITGIAKDGCRYTHTLNIDRFSEVSKPKTKPFRKGWYSTANGSLLWVGESDAKLTREQNSDRLAGMFPYAVVYPGFRKGDFGVYKGYMLLNDGESLEEYVRVRLRTALGGYLGEDEGMLRAFKIGDRRELKKFVREHPWVSPYATQNKKKVRR